MHRLLCFSLLCVSLWTLAVETSLCHYGDSSADIAVYLNTAALEKNLDPQFYGQMMAAARMARRQGDFDSGLPFDVLNRDWELVVNVRFLPGDFAFRLDGMGKVPGGFQEDFDALSRFLDGQCQVSECRVGGMPARRIVLSEETIAAAAEEPEEESREDAGEEGPWDDDDSMAVDGIQSLDFLLTFLPEDCFQFNGTINAALPAEEVTLASPGGANLFVHPDLVLGVYISVPGVLPLLPDQPDNPRAAMLKGFLSLLSHVVVSFQPDGRDLILRVRLAFASPEQASAMAGTIEQVAGALAQSMTFVGNFRSVSCEVHEQFCDISGRMDIQEAAANLTRMMHQ
ncbi:MAG: hypothetical protein II943_11665 [Victivallales bacterium]|nr:hypothetical protein [Victivallales bacterium]